MISLLRCWRLPLASLLICLLPMLSACTTARTAVFADTALQPDEGVVTLRLVDVGHVPTKVFTVVAEKTGEEYFLAATRFGQTSTMTYVGRLPAGRYQPKHLHGSSYDGRVIGQTVPLDELTGKFEVEAQRVTDLGTMIFMEIEETRRETPDSYWRHRKWTAEFALPLDPTPVPTEALLARFPQLAKANAGRSALGWVARTVPPLPADAINNARLRAGAINHPSFVDNETQLAGGALGVVAEYRSGARPRITKIDTVQAIEAVLALKDGRWLAGGEEGLLAISADRGESWQRLPGLASDEVVIHLSQAPDGRLFMVTDGDRGAVVYASAPQPLKWEVIRRLPSEREINGFLERQAGQIPRYLADFAAASRDRLVVYTWPPMVHSLDLRSGQWESYDTPRSFREGIKLTSDGYLIGMYSGAWIYGSLDYGRNWNRQEGWGAMTQPHFIDRQRGVMFSADLLAINTFKLRITDDGGKSWKTGAEVGSREWWWSRLWTDPTGATLYTTTPDRRIVKVKDQDRFWPPR